jgi:TfoX/Sxy family transcriptional regulator of competence genes
MAYNEVLADRVRGVIAAVDGEVTERKMFGGLAFLVNGNMFAGVVGGELMVRLGEDGVEAALRRKHVREMDFTGRPLKSMVYVAANGLEGAALADWVTAAASFARARPAKQRRRAGEAGRSRRPVGSG